jgi:hypothetical protein
VADIRCSSVHGGGSFCCPVVCGVPGNHFRAGEDPLRDAETISTEFRPPKGLGRDS